MDNQKPKDDEVSQSHPVENLGWMVFCIAVVMGVAYFLYFGGFTIVKEAGSWGAMGDYFGGILNPVIAGCALYVLIKSFKVQSQELKQARAELAKASRAQDLQAQLTQKQLEQVDRQNFENLFFQLISVKNRFIQEIYLPSYLIKIIQTNQHENYLMDKDKSEELNIAYSDLEKEFRDFQYVYDTLNEDKVRNNKGYLLKRHIDGFLEFRNRMSFFDKFREWVQNDEVSIIECGADDYYNREYYYELKLTEDLFVLLEQDRTQFQSQLDRLNDEIDIYKTRFKDFETKKESISSQLKNKLITPYEKLALIVDVFENFEKNNWNDYLKSGVMDCIGGYLNTNFQILKLIDEADILSDFDSKNKYIDLYKSQMTNSELRLLFWHTRDLEDFQELTTKYSVFEFLHCSESYKYSFHEMKLSARDCENI